MSSRFKKSTNKTEKRYKTVCSVEGCETRGRTRVASAVSTWQCNVHTPRTPIIGGALSEPDWENLGKESETPAGEKRNDSKKRPRSEKRYRTVCTWSDNCKKRGRTRKESAVSTWVCSDHASEEADPGEGPNVSYWHNEVEGQPAGEPPAGHVYPCTGWQSTGCWCGASVSFCQCAAAFWDNPGHDAATCTQ